MAKLSHLCSGDLATEDDGLSLVREDGLGGLAVSSPLCWTRGGKTTSLSGAEVSSPKAMPTMAVMLISGP
jgi:hypothetical protein